jgi:RNA polymerase sigma-70 factor (ECF subfamily)
MTEWSDPAVTATESAGDVSDEQLLGKVAAGDAAALAALFGRYQAMSYSLAMRITADGALAEDAVQEAFLGVWRNAARFSSVRAAARTWILAIVHHRAIDAVRRRRPATELPDSDATPPRSLVMPDVWTEIAGRLDRDVIRRGLAGLPAPQREAIELAYYGGLTQQEIATRTGAPLGTVKSRVRLGLLGLREALLAEGAGEGHGAGGTDERRPPRIDGTARDTHGESALEGSP